MDSSIFVYFGVSCDGPSNSISALHLGDIYSETDRIIFESEVQEIQDYGITLRTILSKVIEEHIRRLGNLSSAATGFDEYSKSQKLGAFEAAMKNLNQGRQDLSKEMDILMEIKNSSSSSLSEVFHWSKQEKEKSWQKIKKIRWPFRK